MMSPWSVELEPEVEEWLVSLGPRQFAVAASRIDHPIARRAAYSRSGTLTGFGNGSWPHETHHGWDALNGRLGLAYLPVTDRLGAYAQ